MPMNRPALQGENEAFPNHHADLHPGGKNDRRWTCRRRQVGLDQAEGLFSSNIRIAGVARGFKICQWSVVMVSGQLQGPHWGQIAFVCWQRWSRWARSEIPGRASWIADCSPLNHDDQPLPADQRQRTTDNDDL